MRSKGRLDRPGPADPPVRQRLRCRHLRHRRPAVSPATRPCLDRLRPAEAALLVIANIRTSASRRRMSSGSSPPRTSRPRRRRRRAAVGSPARSCGKLAAKASTREGMADPADTHSASTTPFRRRASTRRWKTAMRLSSASWKLTLMRHPAISADSWTWRSAAMAAVPRGLCDRVRPFRRTITASPTTRLPGRVPALARQNRRDRLRFCHHAAPGASQLYERLAGDAPLFDDSACSNYARWGGEQLEARLAREAAGE